MIQETSTTLLRDVASDTDHARWSEFVARYRPMMEAYMRERFPAVEADDAIQETFIALSRILPDYRYSPDEKGHFHNYLTGILRNKALRILRKRERDEEVRTDYAADTPSPAPSPSSAPSSEDPSWRETIFELALNQFLSDASVSDRTKRIFERTALNGESPESVAASFQMSRYAVDQAKSRAMARLRELVKALEDAAEG